MKPQNLLASHGALTPIEYELLIAAWTDVYELLIATPLWKAKLAWAKTLTTPLPASADPAREKLVVALVEDEIYGLYLAARASDSFGAHLERQHRAFIDRIEAHRAADFRVSSL